MDDSVGELEIEDYSIIVIDASDVFYQKVIIGIMFESYTVCIPADEEMVRV